MTKKSRTNGWLVFALLPLAAGLFVIEQQIPVSVQGHELLQGGILLLVFGLMFLWIHASRASLGMGEIQETQWIERVDRDADAQAEPLLPAYSFPIDLSRHQEMETAPIKGRYN